jgi:hydroxymethylpyrimidine pyrophosphatase-like HAD family hydrolase
MVAFPFAPFLMRAGITALGAGAAGEGIKSLQNINPDVAEQAFLRTIIGPISDIFNRTTDTPSGKVFAPTGEVIEPNQIPGIAPPEQQQGITGLPIPEQQQGITGLPIPETQDKLKGFEKPQDVDMKILYKVENDEPKFKYPTKEEIEKYINEENEFWIKNQERANERYPELSSKNLPKITEADKHFGAAAFSFQDFKNSKLIYMSPKEYLNLTQKFRPKEGEENLGSTMNVQNIENLLKEGKELANIPMLYVKKTGDNFVVAGQEGIHRAKAFNNLGYDKIPVVVEGSTRAHAKEIKDIFPTSIQSESGEVLLTKPEDFYSVIGKKPLFTTEQETTDTKPSLTEVSTSPTEPFDVTDTSTVDFFPFNPVDFKKNGILNNPEIIKAFDDLKNDVKIKPPVGFDEDYMALQQSDSFYLTPPRAQMEIALKYLEKQLEENKASEETLNLIKNLNKDLQSKIKDTGYYAENKKVEDRITNLPGMTNKLKKLKSSN